jgi:uncharacterized protein YdeI (YjbR/CyaY-like superfamily)
MADPAYFATEADFCRWLEANHETVPHLLFGFWKKGSGRPSIGWPQTCDQALCCGWIEGHRKSLGDEAYTIHFTPRRKGSIWSKVSVELYDALTANGLMKPAGALASEKNKHKAGVYSYERPLAELAGDEVALFRKNKDAWDDWEKRPAGYRKTVLGWVTGAKRPETRAKRPRELVDVSAAGRRLPRYDWQEKS